MIYGSMLAFLVMFLARSTPAVSQTPLVSVKTEEVRIDMLVTDNGKPVRDLSASDFEVFDNGVLQKVKFASFEQMPISAILVLDMSSSVAGEKLRNLKEAGNGLLDGLKRGDRAALITFSRKIRLISPVTDDIKNVEKTLNDAQSYLFGESSVIDASYTGLILAESKSDRPLVIVFTDGLDNSSWLTEEAVLESAKRSNAVVYAVTAGHMPDKTFLRDISKHTGGSLIEVESTQDLGPAFLDILEEFRHRYLLTYSPTGVSPGGWHRLQVRVKNRNAKILARPGYLSGKE
jgi:Ca-activated chloride channel homolog